MQTPLAFAAFRALSARLGQDPLRVQGPGGNTSIKQGDTLWIKASGTELANAETDDIFVAVSRSAAVAEARGEAGDGSCKATVLDPKSTLRPSIETTFHAALPWPVVAHTHSVATLAHAICNEGRQALREKLAGLPFVIVPYAKPGLPLTQAILAEVTPKTQIFVLENHGLIVCGETVAGVSDLMDEVETRFAAIPVRYAYTAPDTTPHVGFDWVPEGWMAQDARVSNIVRNGTYYPDHVVFLGPALPSADHDGARPAVIIDGVGVALRKGATPSQRAMLQCLANVMQRVPEDWTPRAIGQQAEAELLDWDAEKYRQALAARS